MKDNENDLPLEMCVSRAKGAERSCKIQNQKIKLGRKVFGKICVRAKQSLGLSY